MEPVTGGRNLEPWFWKCPMTAFWLALSTGNSVSFSANSRSGFFFDGQQKTLDSTAALTLKHCGALGHANFDANTYKP